MKISNALRCCSIAASFFPSILCAQTNVIVYTTQMYPIQNEQLAAQVYYLDQVENFEEEISRHLSKSPAVAEHEIRELLNSPSWKAQEEKLKKAYQGVISGWQNGIKKVPAVFFDSPQLPPSVIYGMTDVQKALEEWNKWTQQQGDSK